MRPLKTPCVSAVDGSFLENRDHILFSYILSAPAPTPLLAYLTLVPGDAVVGVRVREPRPKDAAKGKKKPEVGRPSPCVVHHGIASPP